jgi:molybdopterin converting factor small subunit
MAANKSPPGQFNILYFASAASFTRKPSENFPAPVPVTELFDFLEEKYPGIKKSVLSSSALTVNLEYVDVEEDAAAGMVIKEGDEVGIIPPVSSG